jgi:hypothetical protein
MVLAHLQQHEGQGDPPEDEMSPCDVFINRATSGPCIPVNVEVLVVHRSPGATPEMMTLLAKRATNLAERHLGTYLDMLTAHVCHAEENDERWASCLITILVKP